MFQELVLAVENLISLNDQHVKNEAEKMQIQANVDTNLIELQQLRFVVSELEFSLDKKKETYKKLKREIGVLDKQSEALKIELEECEDELDQTQMLLKQKLLIIEQLEKETGEKAEDFHIEKKGAPGAPARKGNYKAVQGDLTDELLAKIIN